MPPILHTSRLGITERVDASFPCDSTTPTSFNIYSNNFGPFGVVVAAVVSAGTPPPGLEPFFCQIATQSRAWMVGTPTTIGVYTYTVDITTAEATHVFVDIVQTIAFVGPPAGPGGVGCSLITITPTSPLDDVFVGEPISIPLTASDGAAPYVWDLPDGEELPDGITLDGAGVLEGAATVAGVYTFTIRATDSDDCPGVISYSLTVVEPDAIIVHPDDPTLPPGVRGERYEQTFTATGGIGEPYEFTISDGELPAGLALDGDGFLGGLLAVAGLFVFTVRATDGADNFGEREYTLIVSGLRIMIAGEDVTIEVSDADLELGLNRQATGSLQIGDGYIPARAADVLIYRRDGVTPIFGGLVLVRSIDGMTPSSPANKAALDLVDYSVFFEDADPISIVTTAPQYLEDLIAEIVAQALAIYGITYDAAPTGQTVPPIAWVAITVPDAFKRINDATGVVITVDPIKGLKVFVPLDSPAPATITDANLNSFDLKWRDPSGLPKNTVDLTCGPTGNGIATQQWESDGYESSWEVDIQAVIGDAFPARRANAYLSPVDATNFSDGDTIGAGASTYTFRTALVGDVAGEVLIGATVIDSIGNLNAAINLAGGGNYAPSTAANADVSSFLRYPDQLTVEALVAGAAGNAITVTSSHEAIAFWYGEGGIPRGTLQLGSDATGAAGWTQGYILENGTVARSLGPPGDPTAFYFWDVTDGRGTVSLGNGTQPPQYTTLELKYLAVFPFHARVPASLPPGTAPRTFREDHPEIIEYAAGIALATQILIRESSDRRELEVFTDVEGFLPGQALEVDTTYRGGIDATFLVATVRIKLVNAELWEYSATCQQTDEYAGSYVDQWKALTSGGGGGAAAQPGTLDTGGATISGDIYSDGRQSFRADQSMGGHKLRFVDDPTEDQDAATKAYVDTVPGVIRADGSVDFTAPQSMGGNALTDVEDPTSAQDAATKAYVDASAGGSAGDRGFFGVGGGAAILAAGPMLVKPSGTTLTFIVGIGAIGTGDALVLANVQLTDLTLDDARAVINRSLVSFGGQHLFGLVHITGLITGKEYVATLQYAARVNAAAFGGGPGPGQPFLVCLDMVTAAFAASLETAEASSSGSMADLATAGPSVNPTLASDAVVAVIAGDSENRVQTGTSSLGILVSGANTLAAVSFVNQSTSGAQNIALQGGLMLSRLASGATTFKLQYASDGGSNTRYARWIAVLLGIFGDTPITFGISQVLTAETRASSAYGALTTADSVTLTTGTSVLVLFSVNTAGSGVIDVSVAVDVSGATTIAAADGVNNAKAITATSTYHVGRGVVMTVNAGSNTFALRYKASTGTGTFSGRVLAVIRLN
jgi:hypothetical protein